MALILFSFSLNTETQEASIAGNIEAEVALSILQQLVVAQAVQRAKGEVGGDGRKGDIRGNEKPKTAQRKAV